METKNEFEQLYDVVHEIGYCLARAISDSETAPYCEDSLVIDNCTITSTSRIGSGLVQKKYVKDFTLKIDGIGILSWRSKDENDAKGLVALETDQSTLLLKLVELWPKIKETLPKLLELKETREKIAKALKDFEL